MLEISEIHAFKTQLEALEQELLASIELDESASQPVALDQSMQGRVSRGDALQQQQMAKASLTRNRKHLVQVKEALIRITDNEYGYCLECGEDIIAGRLKIMPDARLCISCREKCE